MIDDALTKPGARYNGRRAKITLQVEVEGLVSDDTNLHALVAHLSTRLQGNLWRCLPAGSRVTGAWK